ncbi:hypothetical protein KC343_g9886 [Hortaea werneckii]|uniref:SWR1-complex protein 5 n=1 Tax=Hortaea werneckii TaxID=91943 RepID=A0A3M7B2Z2_HORWE|nr:hypothetical protein KC352_g21493 [Hortaea werneckii]KAI7534695.1 hypothetical protein KC317_g18877 [Hortaea werneckii]KAI7608141.1 hypothetical protein KC346_g9735 [Hortaea werneckii]KAI7616052.1 hypothetical protein KC343_g9886 [Hortaea werneckii]KAI7680482.1 hypothetical protein KC319_g2144 [Hortaea werneckii]
MAPKKAADQTALERDMQEDEEPYDENADEDFNPDEAGGEDEEASSSDDEEDVAVAKPARKDKKRKADDAGGEELDSGDEATIQERRKKRKRKGKETAGPADEESGGEGGLIRTRAQRLAERAERKEKKRIVGGEVTIDVEQIWKELNSAPIGRPPPPPPAPVADATAEAENKPDGGTQNKENTATTSPDTLTIRRRIEYAGEVTEITEQVALNSKQAQQYLRDHPEADPTRRPSSSSSNNNNNPDTTTRTLRRPTKRPSLFEPNPTATVKGVPPDRLRPRTPSRLDVLQAAKKQAAEHQRKAEKMSTVQKSALDWKGFVDSDRAVREELDVYGKSKEGFLAREDFLGRADLARVEMGRLARLKG